MRCPSRCVDEVADQPGSLALVAFTAERLWQHRDRHFQQLTRAAYEQMGGVGGALAQHAEGVLDSLPAEGRRLVREAFRHLVTAEGTRAVLARQELRDLLGRGDVADRVIEHLVDHRLLVTSEGDDGADRVEVIHEALLRAFGFQRGSAG